MSNHVCLLCYSFSSSFILVLWFFIFVFYSISPCVYLCLQARSWQHRCYRYISCIVFCIIGLATWNIFTYYFRPGCQSAAHGAGWRRRAGIWFVDCGSYIATRFDRLCSPAAGQIRPVRPLPSSGQGSRAVAPYEEKSIITLYLY